MFHLYINFSHLWDNFPLFRGYINEGLEYSKGVLTKSMEEKMIDAGLSLIVRSETRELSQDLRDKITALEQKYRIRRGDFPIEQFSLETKEYRLDYASVPLLARWGIKWYVFRKIPEVVKIEEQVEQYIGPFWG